MRVGTGASLARAAAVLTLAAMLVVTAVSFSTAARDGVDKSFVMGKFRKLRKDLGVVKQEVSYLLDVDRLPPETLWVDEQKTAAPGYIRNVALCPSGWSSMGGGFRLEDDTMGVTESVPSYDQSTQREGWSVVTVNYGDETEPFMIRVVCQR